MSTSQPNPYDTLPYDSRAFPQAHPNHLAALARVFGLASPRVDTCRILELGCASGGNLIPLAVQFPDASHLGVDLSARQIEDGQATIAQLGLANIELRHASIGDVDASWGTFDYVIAHGVYSWVPDAVQDKLLAICKENLAPNGVAYVSYNTYPGWRMRGMIRDAMRYHAQQFTNPTQQVSQARALIDFLAQNVPVENNPFGMLLKQELEDMRRRGDAYLAHEHLEVVNEPIYFHQFMERAAAKGLQYLAESEFATMVPTNFPPQVAETLRLIAPDVIRMEQYMDFLRNRPFRQTLLVHDTVRLNRNLNFASMAGLYFDSPARRLGPETDLNSAEPEKFQAPSGTVLTTPAPITKAAMMLLNEAWPQSIRFEDLCRDARIRLQGLPSAPKAPPPPAADAQMLGADLLQCFAANLAFPRTLPFRFAAQPGLRPRAGALARLLAARSPQMINLRNEPVVMDEFSRQIIQRLDGEHDRDALVAELAELARTGVLVIRQDAGAPTDPAGVRDFLGKAVDQTLLQLAKVAMLEE